MLIAATLLMLVTAYPAVQCLVAQPSFLRLLAVELLYASSNGAKPADVRTAGFSLAYSLATTIDGFTPAISTLPMGSGSAQHVGDFAHDVAPLPRRGLAHEPGLRIPRAVATAEPAPVGRERQHQPQRLA